VSGFVPESDVADVRQEIFLSFIESLGNFRDKSNFAAWFSSITKRRIADYYRRTSRHRDRHTEDQFARVDDTWKSIDDELTVRKALREMPERSREILSLKYLDGLSLTEISEKLGLTYEAARSRCRRGMEVLRKKVDGVRPA
jgi:RNA polymerase sigma-70 factor (ECF subfamily)